MFAENWSQLWQFITSSSDICESQDVSRYLPEYLWPYLRKPGIRDKSKMHWKCVEKCIDNALQPVENAFQRAGIIFKCVGNVSQCVGNVHQRVEQRIANFINVLRLTIDCFVCHANRRPSILRKTNETLLQILGLCVSPNFRYSSKCFAKIYRSVVHQLYDGRKIV